MEEDRAIADLGPDISADLNGEDEPVQKTPKRRFIGRRAADAKAAAKAQDQETNRTIEDSGAIQGAAHHPVSATSHPTNNHTQQSHHAAALLAP